MADTKKPVEAKKGDDKTDKKKDGPKKGDKIQEMFPDYQKPDPCDTPGRQLKILYTNADSLPNKLEALSHLITGNEPAIIMVTETIPKNQKKPLKAEQTELYTKNMQYHLHTNFTLDAPYLGASGKRGISVYIVPHIDAKIVNIDGTDFKEQLWVEVTLSENTTLLAGCIYRSPSSTVGNNNKLLELIDVAAKRNPDHLLIVGDFNYKDIIWPEGRTQGGKKLHSKHFVEMTKSCGLSQHVTKSTRERPGEKAHTLDLIFTTGCSVDDLEYLPGLLKSDHKCLRFTLDCEIEQEKENQIAFNISSRTERVPRGNYLAPYELNMYQTVH